MLEHMAYGPSYFRGRPLALDMSVAIAQWGDMQIELITQHDDAPSIYTEFSARHGEGLQHVGVLSDHLDDQLRVLAAAGVEPVQWGATANGMRFVYVDTDAHPGGMMETHRKRSRRRGSFLREDSSRREHWDGTRPLRKLG
jgi:methylmalonyl-CoA/ethylmalonyl-CoA epimerase